MAPLKDGQVVCGASRSEPLSRVTCIDAYGSWHLPATDTITLKCIMALLLRGSAVHRAGVLEALTEYLPYGSCLCMSLSPLDAVWPPARADPVALLPTHSAQVNLGSP